MKLYKNIYIIQSENDNLNFSKLVNEDSMCVYVNTYCGNRKLQPIEKCAKVVFLSKNTPDGFYKSTMIKRFRSILNVNLDFLNGVSCENLVISVDGPIQKKIYRKLSKKNKLNVVCWNDGLLEKQSKNIIFHFKVLLQNIASFLKIDYLVPGINSYSLFINELNLLTNSCVNSVLYNGSKAKNIKVVKFPRFETSPVNINLSVQKKRVLFVTSAFDWHGHKHVEDWECNTVKKLSNEYKSLETDYDFCIRAHPRASENLKKIINESGLISTYEDAFKDIAMSNVVISFASTMLFEAQMQNKKIFVYEEGSPECSRGDYIESLQKIRKIEKSIHEY
jgi:hypothetical protein